MPPLIFSPCFSRENAAKQLKSPLCLEAFSPHIPNIFPYDLSNIVQVLLFPLSFCFPICCFTNIFSKLFLHFETSFAIKRNGALKKE